MKSAPGSPYAASDPGGFFAPPGELIDPVVLRGRNLLLPSFPFVPPQNGRVVSMRPVAWPEPDPQITTAIRAMYGCRGLAAAGGGDSGPARPVAGR